MVQTGGKGTTGATETTKTTAFNQLTDVCICAGLDSMMTNPFDDDYDDDYDEGNANGEEKKGETEANNIASHEKGAGDQGRQRDAKGNDGEGDDLDAMLENMDIDKDFNVATASPSRSNSNVSDHLIDVTCASGDACAAVATSMKSMLGSEPSSPSRDASRSMPAWAKVDYAEQQRWRRPEVYSKRYRANPQEQSELAVLSSECNITMSITPPPSPTRKDKKQKRKKRSMFSFRSMKKVLDKAVDSVIGDENNIVASNLISNEDDNPHSIIVHRGKLQVRKQVGASAFRMVDCELMLFTRGFIVMEDGNRVSVATYWNNVQSFEDMTDVPGDALIPKGCSSFCITMKAASGDGSAGDQSVAKPRRMQFLCRSNELWCDAIETVIVENAMFDPRYDTTKFGWQYELIVHPICTMVVTNSSVERSNEDEDVANERITSIIRQMKRDPKTSKRINQLDRFNKCSALHYAVQCDHPNAVLIEGLCDVGADPNLEDYESRSPMYYAERNRLDHVVGILKTHGGKDSEMAAVEQRGALFGSAQVAAAASERRRDRERQVKELEQEVKDERSQRAREKAESAQAAMGMAMAGLQERGQKIDDLGWKTQELHTQAATFGDLAAQLKEKSKKKKWYQL